MLRATLGWLTVEDGCFAGEQRERSVHFSIVGGCRDKPSLFMRNKFSVENGTVKAARNTEFVNGRLPSPGRWGSEKTGTTEIENGVGYLGWCRKAPRRQLCCTLISDLKVDLPGETDLNTDTDTFD